MKCPQELQDEITSINSIYGEQTLQPDSINPLINSLTLPSRPSISLRIEFPSDYPDAPPSVLGTQSVGSEVAKGEGTDLVELVREILSRIYVPGSPCVFDLVEEVDASLLQFESLQNEQKDNGKNAQIDIQHQASETNLSSASQKEFHLDAGLEEPPWLLSDVITEKKSVFVARSAVVSSVVEAKNFLAHLIATDKKVAKATHNMTAWRIRGENGVQFQDCDDDGETAAGSRLLHLLELMGVWNGMVVVSRWYGGVHLGPDRFRIINQTARDALVKAGFVSGPRRDDNVRKEKK